VKEQWKIEGDSTKQAMWKWKVQNANSQVHKNSRGEK
jgi:hypothetical protein